MTVHINIGSNLGNRFANIKQAVALLLCEEWIIPDKLEISKPYESEPWGFDSVNTFINVGVNIRTGGTIPVNTIFYRLKQIEESINNNSPHRDKDGNYLDRILDIDIIAIDSLKYLSEELQIPHPRMHMRKFVLIPMIELWPSWSHPMLKKTPQEMMADLSQTE